MNNINLDDIQKAINRKGKGRWDRGYYKIQNRKKYMGVGDPEFKSSWEKRMMTFCDTNSNVFRWGYEIFKIPYKYQLDKNNNTHNYYTDFYVEVKDAKTGIINKYIIEVKPKKDLIKPVEPKKRTPKSMKNYYYAMGTFIKNQNKWAAADLYCKANGIQFLKLTEDQGIF